MKFLKCLIKLVFTPFRLMPWSLKHKFLVFLAKNFSVSRDSDKSLKFLLSYERSLYFLSDQAALRYGRGEHPKHRLTAYHDFFCENIKLDDKVADLGCGLGFLASAIADKTGAQVSGFDFNSQVIAEAKKKTKSNLNFIFCDITKNLPQEKFNVVVLSNVLEHLKERVAFLKELRDKLSPETCLIRVPLYRRDWRVPVMEELNLDYRLDETHEIEYKEEELLKELSDAGLKLEILKINWGEAWIKAKF